MHFRQMYTLGGWPRHPPAAPTDPSAILPPVDHAMEPPRGLGAASEASPAGTGNPGVRAGPARASGP